MSQFDFPSTAGELVALRRRVDVLERILGGSGSDFDPSAIEAEIAALDTRIDAIEALDITFDSRLDAIEALDITFDSRLDAIEAFDTAADSRLDALEAFAALNIELQTYSRDGGIIQADGTERWYAPANFVIDHIHVALASTPITSGTTIRVNLNGSSLGTVTIAAAGHTNTFVPSTTSISAGDYFTVDVTAVGSGGPGADLVVQWVGRWV